MTKLRLMVYAVGVLALLAPGPSFAGESASQRLERLASEALERFYDLFPVAETMDRGAGPRQDRLEMTFTPEHRERQGRTIDGCCRNSMAFRWASCSAANS